MLPATFIKENYSTENRQISRMLYMGDRSLVERSRSTVESDRGLLKNTTH